jgi:ATP-dependent Clp protease ATP-binding subunit ClpA
VLVSVGLFATAPAVAGGARKAAIVLLADDGQAYVVGPRDRAIQPLSDELLDSLEAHSGELRTVGGVTRVTGAGRIEFRAHFEGEDADEGFVDLGINAAPKGQYVAVHRDSVGNFFAFLDQKENGGAFVFFRPGNPPGAAPKVIPPARQSWSVGDAAAGAAPRFSSAVGHPKESGLLAVWEERLVQVIPPSQPGRPFRVQDLGIGSVAKVLMAGETVFVIQKNGQVARLNESGGRYRAVELPKPIEAPSFLAAYSTNDGNPAETVRAQRRKTAAAPAMIVRRGLPEGYRVEVRAGREVVVDDRNNLVDPPTPSLMPTAGTPESKDFRRVITRVLTDQFAYDNYLGRERVYEGREKEADRNLEILIAPKDNSPVNVGEAGVGKTAVVELLAQRAFLGRLPPARRFELDLKNSVWVETSASMISLLAKSNDANAQALAITAFHESALAAQRDLKRPLIIFIDEMHMLSEAQLNALKPILSVEGSPVRYVFASTPDRYRLMVRYDQATERRTPAVMIEEFDVETTRKLLQTSAVPTLARYFAGNDGKPAVITDDAVEQILRRAREYEPNTAFPAGPLVLASHVVARAHRLAGNAAPRVDGSFVSKFVKESMGLKLDPASPEFVQELEGIRARLKDKIVDQGALVDRIVDLFEDIVDDESGRPHRFLLVAGTTGVGKSYGAEETGAALVGKSRVLTIDCTQFAGAGGNIDLILNKLLGAPPGTLSSDQFIGILPEFLSGRGRGVNVIIWDEVDKMEPGAFKKLMEMFDKGVITAGDGRQYRLGRSLNIMTTNKGASHLYPRGRAGRAISREELEKRLASFSADDIKKWFLEPNEADLYDKSMTLPPEVVQRIHDAIGMLPPTAKGAEYILQQVARDVGNAVEETKGYRVLVDDAVIVELVRARYNPENGLREPKRQLVQAMNSARRLLRRAAGGVLPSGSEVRLRLVPGIRGEAPTVEADLVVEGIVRHTEVTAGLNLRSVLDPLRDPEKRKVLRNLESLIKESVFGQDEMVAVVAQLVRNQFVNPTIKDPVSALLLGPTGVGKTELAKALARVLFGSEDRLLPLHMGNIDHPWDLSEIFNPPRGVRGSESINRFEAFLRSNRGVGGVILLDEIGNMGGGDPKQKAKLLKQFYEMLDEGTYTNKVTGETYDLREFIFILTSNEGQEQFEGAPQDDVRDAIYEELNDEDKLAELLTKSHGWPRPLVARVNALAMARPLSRAARARIARKFLEGTHAAIREVSGIVAFEADEAFYDGFGETFFTHERGARQMRVMIEKKDVASLVTEARMMLDPDDVEGSTFEFSLHDSYANRFRFEGPLPDPRVVEVTLTVKKNGAVLGTFKSENLAKRAAPRILQSRRDIERTAAHEAGHAVVNSPTDTGLRVEYITVQGQGNALGYARYKKLGTKTSLTREQAIATIAYILGGNVGQQLLGHPRDSGWHGDLVSARKEAERAVAKYGLTDEALDLPVEEGKVNVKDRRVQREIAALLRAGMRMAQKRLEQRKALFDAVYEKLVRDEKITAAEYDELERRLEGRVSTGADSIVSPADHDDLDGGHSFCAAEIVQ